MMNELPFSDTHCKDCGCELTPETVENYYENLPFGGPGEHTEDGDGPFCDKCFEVNWHWLEGMKWSGLLDD